MSNQNRKADRTEHRGRKPKRPEAQDFRPSLKSIIFKTALAVFASAVVFAQILDGEGMLAAATRSAYWGLADSRDGLSRARRPDGLTLDDLHAARDAAIRSHRLTARHVALAKLLNLLLDAEEGGQDAAQALAAVRQQAAADPDNLVARLAHAVIADQAELEEARRNGRVPASRERFGAIRAILDAEPPAKTVSLYNAELAAAFRVVVERFVKRPDVAISLAAALPHYEIENHYAALPLIQERLADLSAELRAAGQSDAADQCVRWIAGLTLGLIRAEGDAGTRLLCADLLARSLDGQSAAARGLRRFADDFKAAAASSPIDVCDQSWGPALAVAPAAYKRAFYSLVFAAVLGLIAIGGAVLLAVSCLLAPVFSLARRGMSGMAAARGGHVVPLQADSGSMAARSRGHATRPIYVRLTAAALPSFAIASITVAYLNAYGVYSQIWAFVAGVCTTAFGALLAAAAAGLHEKADRKAARRRVAIVLLLALLGMTLTVLPPSFVTRLCRRADLAVGTVWILLPGLSVLVLTAVFVSPARLRAFAAAASLVWCINMVTAFVVLQCHHRFDKRYQQAVVAARQDEIAARLGPNWQEEYLKSAAEAFNTTKP